VIFKLGEDGGKYEEKQFKADGMWRRRYDVRRPEMSGSSSLLVLLFFTKPEGSLRSTIRENNHPTASEASGGKSVGPRRTRDPFRRPSLVIAKITINFYLIAHVKLVETKESSSDSGLLEP
jgi:hypothetical protein